MAGRWWPARSYKVTEHRAAEAANYAFPHVSPVALRRYSYWNDLELLGVVDLTTVEEDVMGFGRGLLLWLIGIPLPIIILLAIFMHH
jgi:hypothetical protein